MTAMSVATQEKLRLGFKQFNHFMLLFWRLGLGSFINAWPEVGGRIMVLVHTGRKSGLRRQTPVNYAMIDGDIYCTAGFGNLSDWYRNLLVHPEVEIWLPDGWYAGTAEDVTDCAGKLPLMRQVLIASGFAARAAGINPHSFSDAQLAQYTKDYRLVRIRLEKARTGPDGPGDLAWVWPVATFVMFLLARARLRKVKVKCSPARWPGRICS